jgi:hypothetical protein
MIITFSFLVLYTVCQPFCTPGLSNAMSCSLIAQFLSLYAGICLIIESYVQKDLINAGQDDTTSPASTIFEALIVGINLALFVWPLIMFLLSGNFAKMLEEASKPIQAFLKVKEPNEQISKDENESASPNFSGSHILGSGVPNDSELGAAGAPGPISALSMPVPVSDFILLTPDGKGLHGSARQTSISDNCIMIPGQLVNLSEHFPSHGHLCAKVMSC